MEPRPVKYLQAQFIIFFVYFLSVFAGSQKLSAAIIRPLIGEEMAGNVFLLILSIATAVSSRKIWGIKKMLH